MEKIGGEWRSLAEVERSDGEDRRRVEEFGGGGEERWRR